MLAARPSLGHPAILVNEYGSPETWGLPGWGVGWISALDGAGVTGAERSCWDDCGASLDGLLNSTGTSTLPAYWVYRYYASTGGHTVPVSSSYTGVTGVGSVASNGTISILVGRHENCTPSVNLLCPSPPAEPATVRIQVPTAVTAKVTTAVIQTGLSATSPMTSLSSQTVVVPVSNGWINLTTPWMHDGDAVEITVTPSL
jgi:hypothetical protein